LVTEGAPALVQRVLLLGDAGKGRTMISRREFIKYTGMAGVGLVIPGAMKYATLATSPGYGATPPLAKWVDAVPQPAIKQPIGTYTNGEPLYQIVFNQFAQKVHRDLPATTFWGYDGMYPGGTLLCRTGQPIAVRYINHLPNSAPFLPVDTTIESMQGVPNTSRAVVHVHGLEVAPSSDGGPLAWFNRGQARVYQYPNHQQAAMLFYHDHAVGITRLNFYGGMAGVYLIQDEVDDSLNLPKAPYDIALFIQDKQFNADGSLFYPNTGITTVHPVWVPEFFADTPMVNGKIYPYLQVEPRKYRVRILNGCTARFLTMAFPTGQPFIQIGTDEGLMQTPVSMTNLTLGPAEVADCILDFSPYNGMTYTLRNFAPAPYPGGGGGPSIPEIMQFRVTKPLSGKDTSEVPAFLKPYYPIPESLAHKVRDVVLVEQMDALGNPLAVLVNNRPMMAPINIFPERDNIEVWRWVNISADTHPMHVHLIAFQVLDRRPFDVNRYKATGQIVYTGPAVPAAPNERGWKHTFKAEVGMVSRTIAKFDGFNGGYVLHCHILEHEDNDMMQRFEVLPTKYYFAEGTTRPDFQAYFTLLNAENAQAGVKITYMLGNGTTKVQNVGVAAHSRLTVNVNDFLGSADDSAHDFSAVVETTNGVQITAERPMYFNYKGKWTGGSNVLGAYAPADEWYFAEGSCRPNFDSYLTILNPSGTQDSNVKITYMLGNGTTKTQTLTVPRHSRVTVTVKDIIGEGEDNGHDFSAEVETTNGVPIVAERPMYFNYKGEWTGGHCVVGALGSAAAWYFAEGTVRPGFDAFIAIQNPNATASNVKVTYMLGNGANVEQTLTVSPNSRATVVVKDKLGSADDAAHDFSAKVETTNSVNIIAERSMYFNYHGQWTGGHCVMGAFSPAEQWWLAEGTTRPNFNSYITIQNPNPTVDAAVTITYMLGDGSVKNQALKVPKSSRATVNVNDVLGSADSVASDFSAGVYCSNGVWIVVERPMYFNYQNAWTGGHCVVGQSD
jgi:spore coat protein A, manganese oxidase